MHHGHWGPVLCDFHVCAHGSKIRSLILREIAQAEFVTTDANGIADVHLDVFLGLVTADDGYPGDEHRHAQVGQLHAVIAARWRLQSIKQARLSGLAAHSTPNVLKSRGDDPAAEKQTQAGAPFPSADYKRQEGSEIG